MRKGHRKRLQQLPAAGAGVPAVQNREVVFPQQASVAYVSRFLAGGKATLMEMARFSTDPRVQEAVRRWDAHTERRRGRVRIEDILAECKLSVSQFVGEVAGAAHEHCVDIGNLVAAVSHPKVVKKTIDMAAKKDGHRERRMLLEHAGFLPARGGGQTVNVFNKNQVAVPASIGLPSAESDNIIDAEVQRS